MANPFISALTYRDGHLAWTTFRERAKSIEEAGQGEAEIAFSEETEELDAPENADAIKKALAAAKGQRSLAVPTEKVLMRVVDLPATDPEELEGMVELQVDKFSPFPLEHMAVSFEVLHAGEEMSRVLVAATQRDVVEATGGAFVQAGAMVHRMDVEVLGWWYLLQDAGRIAEDGRHVLLIMDGNRTELLITEHGLPIVFRSLGGHEGSPEEMAAELAEEARYTLTSLDAERGGSAQVRVSVWARDPVPPVLLELLQRECGVEPESELLDRLPPLTEGLARRALQREAQIVDLAPAEWQDREQQAQTRKHLLVATAFLLVVWLGVVSVFMGGLKFQEVRLARLQEKVDSVEEPAEHVMKVIDKVRDLELFVDRTYSSIECLREISGMLPVGIDLTSFAYKKSKELNLRGETDPSQVNSIYDFFQKLENSEMFIGIEGEKITTRGQGGRQRAQFTVRAILPGGDEQP